MTSPIKLPSYEDILEIAKKEGDYRLSQEYINQCDLVADEVNGWLRISGEYQKKLVEEAGFIDPTSKEIALNMLRRAQYLGPIKDNSIIRDLVYVKNNKANQGRFRVGDQLEDTTLYDLDGIETIKLFDIVSNDSIPTIIFAGSHT